MINHIYPLELQLNKANVSDTEALFLYLHTRNNVLTANLLKQGYRYHKLRKGFQIFIGGILWRLGV